ncbi:MAG: hypothetical protein ACLTDR_07575 [Adlercreutzia equolifaciens]
MEEAFEQVPAGDTIWAPKLLGQDRKAEPPLSSRAEVGSSASARRGRRCVGGRPCRGRRRPSASPSSDPEQVSLFDAGLIARVRHRRRRRRCRGRPRLALARPGGARRLPFAALDVQARRCTGSTRPTPPSRRS